MQPSTNDSWIIFDYEVQMYFSTRAAIANRPAPNSDQKLIIKNALVESAMLHTRILVDILLARGSSSDDLHLDHLLPASNTSHALENALVHLKSAWGNRNKPNSPCWTLNKMLAHGTRLRSASYDYGSLANAVDPHVFAAIQEITALADRPHLMKHLSQEGP